MQTNELFPAISKQEYEFMQEKGRGVLINILYGVNKSVYSAYFAFRDYFAKMGYCIALIINGPYIGVSVFSTNPELLCEKKAADYLLSRIAGTK